MSDSERELRNNETRLRARLSWRKVDMQVLFVYFGVSQKFDPDKLRNLLETIPGAYNINSETAGDFLVAYRYDFNGDRTTLRLKKNDLETISIIGAEDASLQLALELQGREQSSLIVFNESYTLHVSLKELHSLEEFKQILKKSFAEANTSSSQTKDARNKQ